MKRLLQRMSLAIVLVGAASAPLQGADVEVTINRPRDASQCDLPGGAQYYGSTDRCLEELCAGQNVINEYVFDDHSRRRRNPCYGHSPTEFRY